MILPTRLFQTRLSRFVTATALLSGLWLGSQPPVHFGGTPLAGRSSSWLMTEG